MERNESTFRCKSCQETYPIRYSIPILIPSKLNEGWVKFARELSGIANAYFQNRIDNQDGWWLNQGVGRYQRLLNDYTYRAGRKIIIDYLGDHFSDKLIVDFGGGVGWVAKLIQKKFPQNNFTLIEQDICPVIQNEGLKKYKKSDILCLTSDGLHSGLASSIADVILSTESIEHIRKPSHFLKECNRVLKSNGFLLLTTPNLDGVSFWLPKVGLRHFLRNKLKKTLLLKSGRIGHSEVSLFEYEKILNGYELSQIFKNNGFKIEKHRFTQFLGEKIFFLARRIHFPVRILKVIIVIAFFLEAMCPETIANQFGFTQIVIARKIRSLNAPS